MAERVRIFDTTLRDVEGDTWRLLAVSQRRVEDPHSLGHDWSFHAVRGGGFRGNKKPPGPRAQEVGRAPMWGRSPLRKEEDRGRERDGHCATILAGRLITRQGGS